ncbi:MAG: SPOR domain-containing protein, partial [Hyphomicrobium sp.]
PMDGPTTYKNPAQSGDSMQPVTTAAVSSSDRSSTSWTTASSPSPSNSEFHSSYTSATQRSSDLATSKKVGEGAVSSTVSQPVNTPKSVDQISITNAENIYSNSVSGTPSSQNVTEEPALSTLVGLIENIFGSGTSTENKASSEEGNALATSSTKQIIMTPISQPIVSDWNTTVANTNKRNSQTIKDQMKPTTSTLSEKTKGKYRLQVAVLRSRNKAEDIASELRKKYGNDLGSAVTAIDEVVYGNMGKFYRLQLGPYANAAAAGNFCNVLKPQGYDCMVVTQ